MNQIHEVRTDHCDDQNIVHVDVFFTDDENEGGTVIGYIDLDSRKVIAHDVLLMNEPMVQEAIGQVLGEAESDALLIELPPEGFWIKSENVFNALNVTNDFWNTPEQYPCYAVYVKTELNPNGKDEKVYYFLHPKTYPQ